MADVNAIIPNNPPFGQFSPLKILSLEVLPAIGGEILEEDIPHSGSDMSLGSCMFLSSQDVTSFLSTHPNCPAKDSCLVVAMSHTTVTL